MRVMIYRLGQKFTLTVWVTEWSKIAAAAVTAGWIYIWAMLRVVTSGGGSIERCISMAKFDIYMKYKVRVEADNILEAMAIIEYGDVMIDDTDRTEVAILQVIE